jgi:hypothetical protein
LRESESKFPRSRSQLYQIRSLLEKGKHAAILNYRYNPAQADTLSLTAIIDTALCVGAGGSSGSLADKPIVRTADGRLPIPASQLIPIEYFRLQSN